jgi:hypothetical protein
MSANVSSVDLARGRRPPRSPSWPANRETAAVRSRPARAQHRTPPCHQACRLVFRRSRANWSRDTVLARVASSLDVTPEALEASLFADLPGERIVTGLAGPLSPTELALRANLALTQALLFRATGVTLEVEGNARTLVRREAAGLVCTVSRGPGAWTPCRGVRPRAFRARYYTDAPSVL